MLDIKNIPEGFFKKKVLHDCFQVELAKDLLQKKDVSGVESYFDRMKKCDIRTFQIVGTHLRNDKDVSPEMEKLHFLWNKVASSSTIPNE